MCGRGRKTDRHRERLRSEGVLGRWINKWTGNSPGMYNASCHAYFNSSDYMLPQSLLSLSDELLGCSVSNYIVRWDNSHYLKLLIPFHSWTCIFFPKASPTQNQDFFSKMNTTTWKFSYHSFIWGHQENASLFIFDFCISRLAFRKQTAMDSMCLEVGGSLLSIWLCKVLQN